MVPVAGKPSLLLQVKGSMVWTGRSDYFRNWENSTWSCCSRWNVAVHSRYYSFYYQPKVAIINRKVVCNTSVMESGGGDHRLAAFSVVDRDSWIQVLDAARHSSFQVTNYTNSILLHLLRMLYDRHKSKTCRMNCKDWLEQNWKSLVKQWLMPKKFRSLNCQ